MGINIKNSGKKFKDLQKTESPFVLIHEARKSRWLLFNHPEHIIESYRIKDVLPALSQIEVWTKKGFLSLVKKISGSLTAYERYLESKNKNTREFKLSTKEARKLMDYNNKKIREIEKWVKQKKEQERKG